MYSKEELRVAWNLGRKGLMFRDVVELLTEAEESELPSTISKTFKTICNYFGTHPNSVRGKSRRTEYVKSRMFFSYIACIDYKINQVEVARVMNKDRSSLVHYNQKIQGFLDINDSVTVTDVNNIRRLLES